MDIEITTQAGIPVVRVAGKVDATTASGLERQCESALAQGGPHLIIDFAAVRYVSSAGLRAVLSAGKILAARGGTLHLAAMAGGVQQIFEISGFDRMFPHHTTVEAAIAACQTKA